MRHLIALLFVLVNVVSAKAEQQLPGVPGTISSPPTIMSLPTGTPIGEREMILMLIAERDRQYDQRFRGQELAVAAALTAAKEAVTKAESASEKRFDSVNEFRNTLRDQQATLATKTELDVRFKFLEDKLKSLEERQVRALGSSEGSAWLWAVLVGAAGVLLAAGAMYRSRRAT